jgi:hypothetical protein
LSFVSFATDVISTADSWFQTPIQSIPVKTVGNFSATADGACEVQLADGSVAYVKPRPGAAHNLLLAREKIAFDLAHLLNLPIAPVVVRTPEPASGWQHFSLLSLACLLSGRLWGAGGSAHIDLAAPALEALRVFWTWIGDSDHNGHGQNLLYEIRTGECAVVAIDHSYSLCHGNLAAPLTVGVSAGYGTAGRSDCQHALRRTVTKILSLDDARIEKLVRRLAEILTDAEQDRTLRILGERRASLRRLLGL